MSRIITVDGYPKMWYGLSGPRDWIVVHNRVARTVDMPDGFNGFRFWRSPYSRKHHVLCKCGWRPDLGKHYRMRSRQPDKCKDAADIPNGDVIKGFRASERLFLRLARQ